MGWTFLTPAFLAGLAALAVPVIIHLIHRERREVVAFPSLMFLRKIPYRSVRRQRLRHWLLFLLRALAIILIAAAFARPFLEGRGARAAGRGLGAREVVILLDNSYSMGYGDRWERGASAARRTIDGLAPADRATLVLFADGAEAVTQPTADRAVLRSGLGAARVGAGVTRYAPALKLAAKVLDESERPRKEVVLITDFQRVGWDGREEARLPTGTVLTRVNLAGGPTSNVSVTGVTLQRDYAEGRERVSAAARLTNKGAEPFANLAVTLELNGRAMESKPVTLAPNSAATVAFAPLPLPDGVSRGTVRVGGPTAGGRADALAQDNVFHFTLARGQALSVLVVERPDAAAGQSLYLRRALGIGDRPPFRVEVKRTAQLAAADLDGRSLVVLNDVELPGGETGRRLAEWVRGGGGLVIALGDRARAAPAAAADLLPGTWGALVDRAADGGATLGYLDRSHPVFTVFSAPRSGDWTSPRFFRYRPVEPAGDATVLARFDDGSAALTARDVGRGKVLVWGSTLDAFWTDLPLQPVYLPFVHQLATFAAGYREDAPWFTVGQVVEAGTGDWGLGTGDSTAQFLVETPSGERVRVGGSGSIRRVPSPQSPVPSPRFVRLTEQGFYSIRPLGAENARGRVVAVNLDAAEADLSSFDPEELAAATAARSAEQGAGSGTRETLTLEEQERRQAVWWYLLAGALLLLATETVVGNRLSNTMRGTGNWERGTDAQRTDAQRPAVPRSHVPRSRGW